MPFLLQVVRECRKIEDTPVKKHKKPKSWMFIQVSQDYACSIEQERESKCNRAQAHPKRESNTNAPPRLSAIIERKAN